MNIEELNGLIEQANNELCQLSQLAENAQIAIGAVYEGILNLQDMDDDGPRREILLQELGQVKDCIPELESMINPVIEIDGELLDTINN